MGKAALMAMTMTMNGRASHLECSHTIFARLFSFDECHSISLAFTTIDGSMPRSTDDTFFSCLRHL